MRYDDQLTNSEFQSLVKNMDYEQRMALYLKMKAQAEAEPSLSEEQRDLLQLLDGMYDDAQKCLDDIRNIWGL